MGVGIIESRHHKVSLQIHHLRACSFQLLHLGIGSHSYNLAL